MQRIFGLTVGLEGVTAVVGVEEEGRLLLRCCCRRRGSRCSRRAGAAAGAAAAAAVVAAAVEAVVEGQEAARERGVLEGALVLLSVGAAVCMGA
jgi:hypothetical protein